MSPDDHYQDLKRIIAAVGGKARRITVIMPFLYESRQHKRTSRESLDCALALQELVSMGVDNIITFDAHDPRVQNAIPLHGFETVQPAYQFIKGLLKNQKDLNLDNDHMMVISPDEGGMKRAIYIANVLGIALMGSALIALGVFISSMTENQLVAAVVSFTVSFLIYMLDNFASMINNNIVTTAVGWVSFVGRYNTFVEGVIDYSNAIFFVGFAAIFIFLTVRVLEKRRYS